MILNRSYASAETVLFAYQGLVLRPPPFEYLLLGYALSALPACWLPLQLRAPSHLAIWITYVTLIVPMTFFPYHVSKYPPERVTILVLSMMGAFMMYALLLLNLRPIRIRPIPFSHRSMFWVLLIATGGLALAVAALNGFRLELSLEDTYTRRLEARETATSGSLAGYALAWLAGSFAPLSITYGLIRKRWLLVATGVVGLMAIFSFSGTKSSLFTPIIVLLLFWLVRTGRRSFAPTLILGATALVWISMFLWVNKGNPILSESFSRRLIISKGVSTTFYWQAFEREPMMMRDSIFARLIGRPDVLPKSRIIGRDYGFGVDENYNANAWASAFGNFGYPGLLLCSLLCAILLKLVDGLANESSFELAAVSGAFFAIVWGEQAVETTLLSSGVVVTLGLLWLLSGCKATRTASPRALTAEAAGA